MASSGNDPRLTQGTVVFSNLKLDPFLRWDAPFRWSSLYYHMRNSDLTTIGEKKGIPCTCFKHDVYVCTCINVNTCLCGKTQKEI